jgi:hypothetical protein
MIDIFIGNRSRTRAASLAIVPKIITVSAIRTKGGAGTC